MGSFWVTTATDWTHSIMMMHGPFRADSTQKCLFLHDDQATELRQNRGTGVGAAPAALQVALVLCNPARLAEPILLITANECNPANEHLPGLLKGAIALAIRIDKTRFLTLCTRNSCRKWDSTLNIWPLLTAQSTACDGLTLRTYVAQGSKHQPLVQGAAQTIATTPATMQLQHLVLRQANRSTMRHLKKRNETKRATPIHHRHRHCQA